MICDDYTVTLSEKADFNQPFKRITISSNKKSSRSHTPSGQDVKPFWNNTCAEELIEESKLKSKNGSRRKRKHSKKSKTKDDEYSGDSEEVSELQYHVFNPAPGNNVPSYIWKQWLGKV